jgi:hypothetical protein
VQVDALELLESVSATSSSIDVSWRPPTKNKDRITGYKLMLSSSSGGRHTHSLTNWQAAVSSQAVCTDLPLTTNHRVVWMQCCENALQAAAGVCVWV